MGMPLWRLKKVRRRLDPKRIPSEVPLRERQETTRAGRSDQHLECLLLTEPAKGRVTIRCRGGGILASASKI